MDIFWQITVIQSLQNVAVFAVAVIAFGLTRQATERYIPGRVRLSDAAVGALLGVATAVTLLMPLRVGGGADTGVETILLALAGLIAGPVAAVTALLLAAAALFVPLLHGASLDRLSLATMLVYTVSGMAFRLALKRDNAVRISYFHFPLLGFICATLGLGLLWLFRNWASVISSALPAAASCVLAASALGTLMLHEMRRHEAEKELRASGERLAAQASRLEVQTRDLLKARDAAEKASAAKSTFLANMSHELRTPLNAIIGFSELLASQAFGPLGSARYIEYADDIHSSGGHLLSLINDLLDVAKIEAGKMEVAAYLLDPHRAFDTALKLVSVKAREKNQDLAITIAADAPALYADKRALSQILINLVSNAVKFTPLGGKITVMAGAAPDGGFEIICEDNGPGIPREKLEKVFKPFSQIDNRFDRQEGGTGLGLSLVRGLVELHGGRVWIDSDTGQGCRVHVVLPSRAVAKATAAA